MIKKKYIAKILLAIWLLIIFYFSSRNGSDSTEQSNQVAYSIINFIESITNHVFSENEISNFLTNWIFIIRKSAHFIEYFILGILTINVYRYYKELQIKKIYIPVLFCFIYSISDEIHQLFVVGREARVLDVFIDTSGSLIGILLFYLIYKKIRNQEKIS